MGSSPKYVMFYALFLLCIIHIKAQYTTSDFSPSTLISEGIKAPGRMAIDTDDNVYVTDAIQKNIVKYDGQGNFLGTITTTLTPISIAINNKNQLFIGDKETGAIYKMSSNGRSSLFYSGTSTPNSMVFGSNNILYIVDSKENKVLGLDVAGNVVKDFTHESFTYPTGIAFDHQNNHIIVSEHGGIGEDVQTCGGGSMSWGTDGPLTTIYIFGIEGNLITNFGCFGTNDGLFQRIQGIEIGTCGNIYAVDPYLGRVNVFDDNGNYITKFGLQGDGAGEFNLPMDIVFTSDNRAFVSSMNKGAIDVFSIDFLLPTATIVSSDETICTDSNTEIEVLFTGTAPWKFTYSIDGLISTEITATTSPFYITTTTSGLYKINSLTDANGISANCFTGAAQIDLSAPPSAIFIDNDIEKCIDDQTGIAIQFTGIAPFTFTYTVDKQNPIEVTTTDNLYTLIPEQSGLFEITTLNDSACSSTAISGNATALLFEKPSVIITNGNDQIFIAEGTTTDLTLAFTGTAPWTFEYMRDDLNPITITTSLNPYPLTVSEEGTYEVKDFFDDNNCSGIIMEGYPEVVFGAFAVPPSAEIVGDSYAICEGESTNIPIQFTGSEPWTFSYTIDGQIAGSITTSEAEYLLSATLQGVYKINAVSDSLSDNGTTSGTVEVIVNEPPTVDFFYDLNRLEVQFISDATNADTHYWEFGDGNSSEEANPVHTYRKKGTYTVTYTAISEFCGAVQESKTFKIGANEDTDIIVIYPNPSYGEFTLKISPVEPITTDISILITSLSGQTIYTEVFNPFNATSFDGSIYKSIYLYNFTKGIYLINISAENFNGQEKLLLKD